MQTTCQVQRFLANYPLPEDQDESTKKIKTQTIILKLNKYELLLEFVQRKDSSIRGYSQIPHPIGSKVLTRYAAPVRNHRIEKGTHSFLVSPMAPNNCVCYVRSGRRKYGIVKQIYQYESPAGKPECAVLVRPVRDCFGKDLQSPWKHFRFTLYLLRAVVGEVGEEEIVLGPE